MQPLEDPFEFREDNSNLDRSEDRSVTCPQFHLPSRTVVTSLESCHDAFRPPMALDVIFMN